MQASGNPEVIELLKAVLVEAEKGQLNYIAFVACEYPDKVCYSQAGAPGYIMHAEVGLQALAGDMEKVKKAFGASEPNFDLQADCHEYVVSSDPMNFDFLVWAINAEMIRRREGAPAPLRVCFTNVDKLPPSGRLFLSNVMRPVLGLLGAVEDTLAKGGFRKASFVPDEIVRAARNGEAVPLLKADAFHVEWASNRLRGQKPPVVITLREAEHWPQRNSDLPAWLRFARDLRARDENVIFVRDTLKAHEPLEGFETCPRASVSLNARMALYQAAKMNYFISNGPCMMGIFSDVPYRSFCPLEAQEEYIRANGHEEYYASTPDWFKSYCGIGEGEQWPWALPNQKMIWAKDTYENLCASWES